MLYFTLFVHGDCTFESPMPHETYEDTAKAMSFLFREYGIEQTVIVTKILEQ